MLKPFSWMLLLCFCIFFSCRNSSEENSRAYVEGRVFSSDPPKFTISLVSEQRTVGTGYLQSDGSFTVSGPISEEGFSVVLSEKIKSFQSGQNGLAVTADSLSILVPKGITYLKFNEIRTMP